jgi:uncharacterized protein
MTKKNKMNKEQKIVLITGGSSGIGFEISKYFAQDGYHIVWVSLLEDELKKAKAELQNQFTNLKIDYLCLNLSEISSAKKVYEWTKENNWKIDVLINNAGFGVYGNTFENSMDKELGMIKLNIINLFQLTRLFLDDMIKMNEGTIINISSNSSFQPVVRMNVYASTKAFVTHFSKGLQEELALKKSKVQVMTVCPAAISDTAFKKVGNMDKVKTFNGLAATTAKEVAQDVWNGFVNKKTFVVSGWKMRILYFLSPIVPYSLQQFMVNMETKEGK